MVWAITGSSGSQRCAGLWPWHGTYASGAPVELRGASSRPSADRRGVRIAQRRGDAEKSTATGAPARPVSVGSPSAPPRLCARIRSVGVPRGRALAKTQRPIEESFRGTGPGARNRTCLAWVAGPTPHPPPTPPCKGGGSIGTTDRVAHDPHPSPPSLTPLPAREGAGGGSHAPTTTPDA